MIEDYLKVGNILYFETPFLGQGKAIIIEVSKCNCLRVGIHTSNNNIKIVPCIVVCNQLVFHDRDSALEEYKVNIASIYSHSGHDLFCGGKFLWKPETLELTLESIAAKFGVSVDKIKIKK